MSAISVFFNVASGEKTNGFFDFLTQDKGSREVDVSKLLTFGAGMTSDVIGYNGSDSMPNCTASICWYLYRKPF